MAVGIPVYPSAFDTEIELVEATNNAQTTLSSTIAAGAASIPVASTTGFPSTGILRIDNEYIAYSSKTASAFAVQSVPSGRGYENTTDAQHLSGANVELVITALSNNAKNLAVQAIEAKLGIGNSTPAIPANGSAILKATATGESTWSQWTTADGGFTTSTANGGTVSLTNTSSAVQERTGTSSETVRLPSTASTGTTTAVVGQSFTFINRSSQVLTIQTFQGVATLGTVQVNQVVQFTCKTRTSSSADWVMSRLGRVDGGVLWIGTPGIDFAGTSGTTNLKADSTAAGNLTLPPRTGTLICTGDSGTVTNSMLVNSAVTVNGTSIALGNSGTVTATATNALTIGTGLSGSSYNGSVGVTIAIDSTVATLTGSQNLQNKTLTNAVLGGTLTTASGSGTGSGVNGAVFYSTATGTRWSDRVLLSATTNPAATTGFTSLELDSFSSTAGDGSMLILSRARNSLNSPQVVSTNDVLGAVSFTGQNTTSTTATGAAVTAFANSPWSGSSNPAYIDITATPTLTTIRGVRFDGNSLSPRSSTDAPNLGLGTQSVPWAELFVSGQLRIVSNNNVASIGAPSLNASQTYTLPANTGQLIGSGDNATVTSAMIVSTLASKQLGNVNAGVATSCTVDGTNEIGFRAMPVNAQNGAYTFTLADAGKTIYSQPTGNITMTLPGNSTTAFPVGTVFTVVNDTATSSVVLTIATTDTIVLAGSVASTNNRSIAQFGVATLLKVTSTRWLMTGTGVS